MKMNIHRAQELIAPLKNGKANGISPAWKARLIEALEYVIENEAAQAPTQADECEHVWLHNVQMGWKICDKCDEQRDEDRFNGEGVA